MRSEVKIAMVVVLVGVVVSAFYFFGRGGEKTIELHKPKPLTPALPPRVSGGDLPLVSSGSAGISSDNKTIESTAIESGTTQPADDASASNHSKPVIKLDLTPLGQEPVATQPQRSTAQSRKAKIVAMQQSADRVIPNHPISIEPDVTVSADENKSLTAGGSESTDSSAKAATTHVVKAGETLYQIARHYYGNGEKYRLILKANPKISASRLRPGQKLIIPADNGKAKAKSKAVSKSAKRYKKSYKSSNSAKTTKKVGTQLDM